MQYKFLQSTTVKKGIASVAIAPLYIGIVVVGQHRSHTLAGKLLKLSQRGNSPFVYYRDGAGWLASLPYIRKTHVSVAIGTQSRIHLHERVPMVKIWGSSKYNQNWTTGRFKSSFSLFFIFSLLLLLLLFFSFD